MAQEIKHKVVDARHPEGASWCFHCNHYALSDTNHNCICCGDHVIIKPRKYHKELQEFAKFVMPNINILDSFMNDPKPDHLPKFVMQLGHIRYLVDLNLVAEFSEMCKQMDYKDFEVFLSKVKETSSVLPRYGIKT